MGNKGTLDGRLKKIRKELSLIDDDLKSLSKSATVAAGLRGPRPKLKSRELREQEEAIARPVSRAAAGIPKGAAVGKLSQKVEPPKQDGKAPAGGDERFLEYLSTSFNSGLPLRQERKLQRNKAIVMLVVVLFFLFLVLYRMFM